MRTLTDHIVEGDSVNHQVVITVTDQPGAGGANHEYHIDWLTPDGGMNDTKPKVKREYIYTWNTECIDSMNYIGMNGFLS